MNGTAVANEGYTRAVTDMNWDVVYGSPWPEPMALTLSAGDTARTEALAVEALPVLYTTQGWVETMISDTPLSNVATFFGFAGRVGLGTFDAVAQQQTSTAVPPQPTAAEQLSAHASGDWFVATREADAPTGKKVVKVDWKGVLNKFVTFPNKDKAGQSNLAEFSVRQPSRGVRE
jgi:hypothetical protein